MSGFNSLKTLNTSEPINVPEIRTLPLINSTLPKPKSIRPKSSIKFREDKLRKGPAKKHPMDVRGKQCAYAFDTGLYAPLAFAPNQNNEEQSLYARVLAKTIEPTDALEECIDWCKSNHKQLFPRIHNIKSDPFDVYLANSNASPSVKRILQKTYEAMTEEGYDEDSVLTPELLHRWTTRSSFVKVENNLYQSPAGIKEKAPRLIQGAQPEFIVIVGPWISALQRLIKRRWSKKNFLCFTSGVSALDQAAVVNEPDWLKVEDDLGKFDCSIRRPWCEYELWLCKQFGAPLAVLDLMEANISTHGYTLNGWQYKVDGTRKSGDPYTSLMNSIINGLSHLHLYCKWTNKSVSAARFTIKMLLQGDDNCLVHKEDVQFPWQQGMAGLGFDSEAIYRATFEEIEFCSNRLYYTNAGLCFGPKPGKVLAKLGYIINPPVGVSREGLIRGVALGLQKSCNFIPPLKAVVDRLLVLTKDHKAETRWLRGRNQYWLKEITVGHTQVLETTPEIMSSLNSQYDWDYRKQRVFEHQLSEMNLGDKMSHPYFRLLFDRDTSAPQVIFGDYGNSYTVSSVSGG